MIEGTIVESIVVEAPVAATYAGLSDANIRSVWAKLPGRDRTYELDFRVGGEELRTSTFPNIDRDEVLDVRTRFLDIVEQVRVVSVFEFRLDGVLRNASLSAWELTAVDGGTRVDYTDQFQILVPTGDGTADRKERKGATPMMLRAFKIAVEASLQGESRSTTP